MKGYVDTELRLHSAEITSEHIGAAVHVFGFGDKADTIVWVDIVLDQYTLEGFQRGSVANQHLVLIELDFLLFARVQHGNAGASIVEYHLFKVIEDTLEDWNIDMLTVKILMFTCVPIVAGLENDVDRISQAVDQVDEQVKEPFSRRGRHDHRNFRTRLWIYIRIVPKSLLGYDLQVKGRSNRFGQVKRSIAKDFHVRLELMAAQLLKAGGR